MTEQVHDALFKHIFSQPEHAISVLREILPAKLSARIDWKTLRQEPGSVVDQTLSGRHTDILFSVSLSGRRAFIYVLFEHQSDSEVLMTYRLLAYMVRIWGKYRSDNPNAKKLPAILPVVLHHSEQGWTRATSFEEELDLDEETLNLVAEHIPRFRFLLEDISHQEDDALRERAMTALARLGLFCLKNGRRPDHLLAELVRWTAVVREVIRAPNGMAALAAVLRYIYETNERITVDEIKVLVAGIVGKEAENEVMTLAERLRQEGETRGLSKGLAPLTHLFERRLKRHLSEDERSALQERLHHLGPDRLGDVVLDLAPEALAAWLADPDAR